MDVPSSAALPALERAFAEQRAISPEDGEALDRLYEHLLQQQPTMFEIKDCICEFYDVTSAEVMVGSRMREVVFARQMLCYLSYKYTRHTLQLISRRLGYRDNHSTAHHAVRKIERLAVSVPLVRDDIDVLRMRIAEKIFKRGRSSC